MNAPRAATTSAHTTESGRTEGPGSAFRKLFAAYADEAVTARAWDEALSAEPDGPTPRRDYAPALTKSATLERSELDDRQSRAEAMEEEHGITFRVTGEKEPRIFPMDLFPRIISAETWNTLSRGLEQRARALNAFLDDVYGTKEFVTAGYLEEDDLQRTPGFVPEGRLQPAGAVRAHICGMDLVCTDDGRWLVLEDNLRVPSGIVFSHFLRSLTRECNADILDGYAVRNTDDAFAMLRETLLAAVPANAQNPDNPRIALVSAGESDSAWFEHRTIAEMVGMPVCIPDQLAVIDGYLHRIDESGTTHSLDVVYARIEQETLFAAEGFTSTKLGPGLTDALSQRRLTFVNTFGNGVGDDKAMYALVPDMIRFFLDEEPLLDQVPTVLCHKEDDIEKVIDRLDSIVVKPVDGYGGSGITVGPECTQEELQERAAELREHPERFIAQDIVRLSTLPTYGPDAHGETVVHPRHVDLRVFVHVRATHRKDNNGSNDNDKNESDNTTAHTVPAALTRTAAAGSLIVNTSRGGGGKDTWILAEESQGNSA